MKYQYFYTRDFIPFLHFERKLALSIAKFFQNIYFSLPFSLFSTMSKVCNISNKTDFLINQLQKYFYTKHLTLLLYFKQKSCALDRRRFRKIDFLPHFCLVSRKMRCVIFQTNTNLVKIYEHINMFTLGTS